MELSKALKKAKGKSVKRPQWENKEVFTKADGNWEVYKIKEKGIAQNYVPEFEDMFAKDWDVID